jgi:hypothetical protein
MKYKDMKFLIDYGLEGDWKYDKFLYHLVQYALSEGEEREIPHLTIIKSSIEEKLIDINAILGDDDTIIHYYLERQEWGGNPFIEEVYDNAIVKGFEFLFDNGLNPDYINRRGGEENLRPLYYFCVGINNRSAANVIASHPAFDKDLHQENYNNALELDIDNESIYYIQFFINITPSLLY